MRLKNIPGAREAIAESKYVIPEEEGEWSVKGKWRCNSSCDGNMTPNNITSDISTPIFTNDNPIWIEIGMGKGTFIMEMARLNPNINFVGIEKYSSVLLRAVQKQEEAMLENVKFIRMDAEYICDVFAKDEVDKIFLNFSDPWPKKRTAKRRLTSRQFLERYDAILKADGVIEFKTDNEVLFDFSLEEVEETKWNLVAVTRDLHHDETMNKGNVMTEYEAKFSAKGNPIFKYIINR